MPVVWAVTLGSNHRACRVKSNPQVPAHKLLQHNVPTVTPRTSSLPQMQIQISPTDLSSWKSLYIPLSPSVGRSNFRAVFLGELLTNSESGSEPRVASFCWFVLGQPEGARWNWSDASAVQLWTWGWVGSEARENRGQLPRQTQVPQWNLASCLPTQVTDTSLESLDRLWRLANWNFRKKNGVCQNSELI